MDRSSLLGGNSRPGGIRGLSPKASQQLALALSLLAVGCAVGAMSGYSSGWTRYHSESFTWPELHRETPITVDIRQGWWESRTVWGISKYAPSLFKIDGTVIRGFGALAAGGLFCSVLLGLMVVVATTSALLDKDISSMPTGRRLHGIALIISLVLYVTVVVLYAALAISLRHETKRQLDVAILPRPDWACGLGILAAITWTLLTAVHADMRANYESAL